jgi:hypothetical protein
MKNWQQDEIDAVISDVKDIYEYLTSPDAASKDPVMEAKVASVTAHVPHVATNQPIADNQQAPVDQPSWSDNAAVQSGIENMVPYEMRDMVYRVVRALEHNPRKLALAVVIGIIAGVMTGHVAIPTSIKNAVSGLCPTPQPLQLPPQIPPTPPLGG